MGEPYLDPYRESWKALDSLLSEHQEQMWRAAFGSGQRSGRPMHRRLIAECTEPVEPHIYVASNGKTYTHDGPCIFESREQCARLREAYIGNVAGLAARLGDEPAPMGMD